MTTRTTTAASVARRREEENESSAAAVVGGDKARERERETRNRAGAGVGGGRLAAARARDGGSRPRGTVGYSVGRQYVCSALTPREGLRMQRTSNTFITVAKGKTGGRVAEDWE